MTIDELARMISRGFAAMAEGQEAIAAELRATRVQIAKVKGQRELDQEAHEADLNALGTQVQEVERKLRLVPPPGAAAVKEPAE
jgi:hypothetical protein